LTWLPDQMAIDGEGPLILDEPNLMLAAARAGIGLAYLSEWNVAADLAAGSLIRVLDEWTAPFPGLSLYYPTSARARWLARSDRPDP
jgi:DNA-binding transcriptional LysR family regulator